MVFLPVHKRVYFDKIEMLVFLPDNDLFRVFFEMTPQLRATGENTRPVKTTGFDFLPPCKTVPASFPPRTETANGRDAIGEIKR